MSNVFPYLLSYCKHVMRELQYDCVALWVSEAVLFKNTNIFSGLVLNLPSSREIGRSAVNRALMQSHKRQGMRLRRGLLWKKNDVEKQSDKSYRSHIHLYKQSVFASGGPKQNTL